MKIALIGATAKTGRLLLAALRDADHDVVAIGRDEGRLRALDARGPWTVADLERPKTLIPAVRDADLVVSLAHARFTGAVLAAAAPGQRLILTGSTRVFSALPDPAAEAVRAAERLFLDSGRAGLMLHPSMIYGAPEDRNIARLFALFEGWPRALPVVVPLPGGGRATVQPIHAGDVVAAFLAAVARPDSNGPPIVVAGPAPVSYADLIRAIARRCGRRAAIAPVPTALLAWLADRLSGPDRAASFSGPEIRRAAEAKAFDIAPLRTRLGIEPRSLDRGLDEVARARRGEAR